MKSVSATEMRELDRKAIEEYGIPSLLLMENAGRGVAELIFDTITGKRACIFAGKGNNGGDGLVIARHLWNRGFEVMVLLFAEPMRLNDDPAVNFKIMSLMRIPFGIVTDEMTDDFLAGCIRQSDVVVDALFGVGLSKPLSGIFERGIRAMNQASCPVVAVDIPSGLDADTGEIHGCAVKASVTATLGLAKHGLFRGEGPRLAGRVCIVDISLPREIL